MNGETLFSNSHTWHDPRTFQTSWGYNDVFYDPQAFAPGNHPAHNHYSSGYQSSRASFPMGPYNAQYTQPDFWHNVMPFASNHGHTTGHGRSIAPSLSGHGVLPPPQYFANAGHGYPVNLSQAMRTTAQMAQYGYGNYQRPSLNLDVRGMSAQPGLNEHTGLGPSCNHCNHSAMSSPQTARSTRMPMTPASPPLARGPPRKPKRSGHAVWVGNIPLGASIEALKDHFSRQATRDIESVFLMAKSNCAFVNYDTEEACVSAVERFNHSLFGSVRLLCRMRREPAAQRDHSSTSGASLYSDSPASSVREDSSQVTSFCDELATGLDGLGIQHDGDTKPDVVPQDEMGQVLSPPSKPTDRYFIVKSLTKEDLQNSLQTGTWETQPHNQRGFDDAFRETENVYIIFSVNKSGEYFGYARMISSPLGRPLARSPEYTSSTPPKQNDTLKITQTAATATAPAGYIIDDTVRGTLFWEAQHEENGVVSSTLSSLDRAEQDGHVRSRPFQVEWLSVRRVTFQRTKGIRNPWNNNKEVKVARDGTELETETGKKIVALFHESYEEMMRRA